MEKWLLTGSQLASDLPYYTLRQASRRSWRIGSRFPVEVSFLVYDGTLQAEALALVAAKLRAALLVEGELPEDGLGDLAGGGEDVFLALARRLAGQTSGEGHSLEALFAEARATEAMAATAIDARDTSGETAVAVPITEPSSTATCGQNLLELAAMRPKPSRRRRQTHQTTNPWQPSLFGG